MKQLLFFMFLMVVMIQSSLFGECTLTNFDNKSYQFCLNLKSWNDAQTDCTQKSMNLVSNISMNKHDFIVIYLSNNGFSENYWIGLNDIATENELIWVNGTQISQNDDISWGPGQPDNYNNEEDCIEMRFEFDYLLNDNNCGVLNYYICEGAEGSADNDYDGFPSNVDCNDNNPRINPATAEICNGIDENCNVQIDENCVFDNDNDGYPEGIDCNDNNPTIHPNAMEICNNTDDDCDNQIDDACISDDDNDGFPIGPDCDDNNANINPLMPEFCNGIDDNCNGQIDDNCFYADNDNDGFPLGIDCDDNNWSVNPAAQEQCNNIDDDCNGLIDDNCISDSDSDGNSDDFDNCPYLFNPDQSDMDNDTIGDACDDDNDNDNIFNSIDNCPVISNEDQLDSDEDGIGDLCDNCKETPNPDQKNTDGGLINELIIPATQYLPFNSVYDIEHDNDGYVYITDKNINMLAKFDPMGVSVALIPVLNPGSIEIYNNELYVVDNSTKTIKVFNTSLELLKEIPVDFPNDDILNMIVKYDEIYVSSSKTIKVYDLSESLIKDYMVTDTISTSFDIDSEKNIYYADPTTNEIIKRTNSGVLITKFGGRGATNGKFLIPSSLKIDSNDNIYISDSILISIQKFTKTGEFVDVYYVSHPVFELYAFELTNDGFYVAIRDIIFKTVIGDKLGDACDNCVNVSNQDQINIDKDEFGDACDANYCSESQPLGQCYDSTICDLGTCVDAVYSCSPSHTDGYCEAGKVCRNGNCVNKVELCSDEFPIGYCENNKVCDDGICVDKINYCSSEHTDGYCESGKFCDEGVCVNKVYACSPMHLDGLCQVNHKCIEGVCVISNDNNNSSGSDDGCSFSGTETRQCLVSTEIIMLFMMVIGLIIKRKYNK